MSRYNYGSNYYDPVGSQPSQPSGYTYQNPNPTTAAPTYPATSSYSSGTYSNSSNNFSNAYSTPQYAASAANATTDRAAATLSSMNGQSSYNQAGATDRGSSKAYGSNASWTHGNAGYTSGTYAASQPDRTQSNNSPLYPTHASSSTFGSMSVPEPAQTQTQTNNTNTYRHQNAPSSAASLGSSRSYPTSYTQPAQTQQSQPPRYNSPLHVVQAQQRGHQKQASRTSTHQPSPQTSAQSLQQSGRQQSASVEPSPTTVDPSQIYDNRAELQRKAAIEAERRRKRDEAEAARKAEEERVAAAERKQKEEEEEKRKFEAEVAVKKAEAERKAEARKKARLEKQQSKSAATALQKMASGGAVVGRGQTGTNGAPTTADGAPPTNNGALPLNDEEEEMRAMFQKMREFNAKNPAMLAKLWEEERKSHGGQASQSPQSNAAPATASVSKSPQQQRKSSGPSTSTPATAAPQTIDGQQVRSFKKQSAPTPAKSSKPSKSEAPMTTSLWPAQKKGALADKAGLWLSNLPQNAGKVVKKEDLLKILDTNPSYVQLCDALELLGLSFQRAALARELLKVVPEGLRPQQVAQNPVSTVNNGSLESTKKRGEAQKGRAAGSGPVEYEVPAFHSLAETARELYRGESARGTAVMQGGPVQAPFHALPQSQPRPHPQSMLNGNRAPSQSQPSPAEIKAEEPPREPPRPPANKEEAARKRTFGDLVDLTAEDSDDDGPPKKMMLPPVTAPQVNGVKQQVNFQQPLSTNNFMLPGQQRATTAPTQAAAPAQTLPPAAAAVPKPPPAKPKGPSAESLQQERLRGKMLVEPLMRDRVARKSKYDSRTLARDVLLATGRHPDMRALNAHLGVMQRLLGDHGGSYDDGAGKGNRSDLGTIRWDIVDPVPPKVQAKSASSGSKLGPEVGDADDEDDEEPPGRMVQQLVDNGDGTVTMVALHQGPRGRPRKKKRRDGPAGNSLPANAAEGQRGRPAGTPARDTNRPVGAPNSAPAPVGYAAFRQVDADGNVIKRKGRPVGWKKNLHSRAAMGLPPKPSGSSGALPHRSAQKDKELQEPRYQVYKCQWRDCKAELHNLETLRKHVVKVHGRPDDESGDFECWWSGCDGKEDVKGKGRKGELATFDDIESWIEHVDGKHLQPVGWKLGDGPRGGVVGKSRSGFHCASVLLLLLMSVPTNRRLLTPQIPTTQSPTPPTSLTRKADP